MSQFDFAPYLRGGGTRQDAISGLDPAMQNALAALLAEAPAGLTINSAYRSPEVQAELWRNALERYGSEAEARRWVAPPGRSQHNHGRAVDLGFADDAARTWAHENASRFGLHFPLDNENWHLEMVGARDGHSAPQAASHGAASQPSQNQLAGLLPAPDAPVQQPEQRNRLAMLDVAPFMASSLPIVPVDFTPQRGFLRT